MVWEMVWKTAWKTALDMPWETARDMPWETARDMPWEKPWETVTRFFLAAWLARYYPILFYQILSPFISFCPLLSPFVPWGGERPLPASEPQVSAN